MVRFLGLVLLSLFSVVAVAAADESVVNAETVEKLAAVQAEVIEEMDAGGRYEFISKGNREQVEALFRDMRAMLGKSGSVEAMAEGERVKLFNLQERLNGLLTSSDSKRLVCERAPPTGSLIPKKTCRTYGEIERQRREKDSYLEDTKRQHAQTVRGG